jgi:hypothetical protein
VSIRGRAAQRIVVVRRWIDALVSQQALDNGEMAVLGGEHNGEIVLCRRINALVSCGGTMSRYACDVPAIMASDRNAFWRSISKRASSRALTARNERNTTSSTINSEHSAPITMPIMTPTGRPDEGDIS